VKFTVEAWDPDYGAPSDPDLADSTDKVDPSVEISPEHWHPLLPDCAPAEDVLFVDGVRRVDANLWIDR